MKYGIVVTMIESTIVEAPSREQAEALARKFENEVESQYLSGNRDRRTMHVTATSHQVTLTGLDDTDGGRIPARK